MATYITGTCAICGPVKFNVEQISLISYAGARPACCLWRCPACDTPRMQAIEEPTCRELRDAGVRVLTIRVESPRSGGLDLDYMITINDDLEQL